MQVTPALAWLQPALAECAGSVEGIGLVFNEIPASSLDPALADLTLRLGSNTGSAFVYQIGEASLVLAGSPDIGLESIPLVDLASLYSAVPGPGAPLIQIYTYLPGDDLRLAVEAALGISAGRLAVEAPNQQAVIQAVREGDNSLGIILGNLLAQGMNQVTVTGIDPASFSVPIVAVTPAEPTGSSRELLACLQSNLLP